MSNRNVQQLSNVQVTYTVRIMDQSARGGIIGDRRDEHFLVLNVSPMDSIDRDKRLGCATVVFDGDDASALPTASEVANCDLEILGTWSRHAVFGPRFDVIGWRPLERPKAAPPAKAKTRLLGPPLEAVKPAKPKTRRLPAKPAKGGKASRAAIGSTNDWYANRGDSLDFLNFAKKTS